MSFGSFIEERRESFLDVNHSIMREDQKSNVFLKCCIVISFYLKHSFPHVLRMPLMMRWITSGCMFVTIVSGLHWLISHSCKVSVTTESTFNNLALKKRVKERVWESIFLMVQFYRKCNKCKGFEILGQTLYSYTVSITPLVHWWQCYWKGYK